MVSQEEPVCSQISRSRIAAQRVEEQVVDNFGGPVLLSLVGGTRDLGQRPYNEATSKYQIQDICSRHDFGDSNNSQKAQYPISSISEDRMSYLRRETSERLWMITWTL